MLKTIDELLWGPGTLLLLLGTGIFLHIRLRFLPWRNLGRALSSALGRTGRRSGNGISPFSALMTALAATLGTGNIVGVATALVAGGPGALVWMEVSALLGMSIILTESTLAVRHRRKNRKGEWVGGPMYVMEARLGAAGRPMAMLFSLFAACASLGIGSMTQANAAAGALESILSDQFIFGCNLYEVGAADTVTEIFRELNAGPGAVRKTLEKYTAAAKNA